MRSAAARGSQGERRGKERGGFADGPARSDRRHNEPPPMRKGGEDERGGELPTRTVPFLFTDIEGSTRLLDALGDRYPAVLETHQAILREAFAARGGIDVSTEGDSFFVVFRSAPQAVAAAVEAQRAIAAHRWPEDATVRVRMGMHTGEGTLGGGNYAGGGRHPGPGGAGRARGRHVPGPRRAPAAGPAEPRASRAGRGGGPARGVSRAPVDGRPAEQLARAAHHVRRQTPGARFGEGRGAGRSPPHADGPRRYRKDPPGAQGRRGATSGAGGRGLLRSARGDNRAPPGDAGGGPRARPARGYPGEPHGRGDRSPP